nr:unnamed protein product [Naegleria fowleri]
MPNNYCGGGIDTLPIAQIACGSNHCILLTERNELYYQASPTFSCGRFSNVMNNNLQTSAVVVDQQSPIANVFCERQNDTITHDDRDFRKLNFGKKIRMVAASSDQFFVITKDDEIYYTFGGRENLWNERSSSIMQVSATSFDGSTSQSSSPQFQLFKPWQQVRERIEKFVASSFTSCFIIVSTEGKIYVSGSQNSFTSGMLGIPISGNSEHNSRRFQRVTLPGNERSKIKIVAIGGQHTIIVTERNEFYCSGSNIYYQLGFQSSSGKQTNFVKPKNIPFIGKRIESVSCGYDFTFVLVEGNILYACGNSSSGCLGFGTFERINFFTRISFSFPIRQVVCGEDFTMIQTNNGLFYRAGSNRYVIDRNDVTF